MEAKEHTAYIHKRGPEMNPYESGEYTLKDLGPGSNAHSREMREDREGWLSRTNDGRVLSEAWISSSSKCKCLVSRRKQTEANTLPV